MAYTAEEKESFNTRLTLVKKRFSEKRIKYYADRAKDFDQSIDAKVLYNVMHAGVLNEKALRLLELVAGIAKTEEEAAGVFS